MSFKPERLGLCFYTQDLGCSHREARPKCRPSLDNDQDFGYELDQEPKGKSLVEASEKQKAFDLLDALSRSGSLEIPFSELHVLICATLSFEKSVMETVIQDNINPIEKLEMSTLLMGSTVLDTPAYNLIGSETNRKRLKCSYPQLVCRPDDSIETSNKMDDNLELEDC